MASDYIIVGAGLYGSVMARVLAEGGKSVLLLERREHIGGNCYTENCDGVHIHRYGAHIFHTNNERVWKFVNRFVTFNSYVHRVVSRTDNRLFSFPINLLTLHQLWGVTTPAEAKAKLQSARLPILRPRNLEEWALSEVGPELYELFVKGYTQKQWGVAPSELPAGILRRIPIRLTWDDRYFSDLYQGIPTGGYTRMFENMLDHENIRVVTGTDFLAHRKQFLNRKAIVVYSGRVDELFEFRIGRLNYRSLRFEDSQISGDYQGTSVVNYPSPDVAWTRILEHRHFDSVNTSHAGGVVTREYPAAFTESSEPYYPIRDASNAELHKRYIALADAHGIRCGGRLGSFQYYDMHQVVAEAMTSAERELYGRPNIVRAA